MSSTTTTKSVERVLSGTSSATFTQVARGALNDNSAVLTGAPKFEEIATSHNDQRTLGIVKVFGEAAVRNARLNWSSVVKIIDPNAAYSGEEEAGWVSLDIERQVYDLSLFSDPIVPFRPAHCYLTSSNDNGLTTLWLEDLSNEPQPPWNLAQFVRTANNLGQFNRHYGKRHAEIPFDIPTDIYYRRWGNRDSISDAIELVESRNSIPTREAYRDVQTKSALELATLSKRLFDNARSVQHSLSFGDSHSRNLFPTASGTVGIDWTGIANEPTGTDIGVLIGSALSFSVQEAQMVATDEREIYESYLAGLQSDGQIQDLRGIRIGFFAQFLGYLNALSTFPLKLPNYAPRKEWVEKRFGVPFDDVPRHLAPVIDLIPKYVKELKQLLD